MVTLAASSGPRVTASRTVPRTTPANEGAAAAVSITTHSNAIPHFIERSPFGPVSTVDPHSLERRRTAASHTRRIDRRGRGE